MSIVALSGFKKTGSREYNVKEKTLEPRSRTENCVANDVKLANISHLLGIKSEFNTV